jgi:hypothetical protein
VHVEIAASLRQLPVHRGEVARRQLRDLLLDLRRVDVVLDEEAVLRGPDDLVSVAR